MVRKNRRKRRNCWFPTTYSKVFRPTLKTFPNNKFQSFPNGKRWQKTISGLMKMTESSPKAENTVGKGKIAHHEQFLIFPVFSKDFTCNADMEKTRTVWQRVKHFLVFRFA